MMLKRIGWGIAAISLLLGGCSQETIDSAKRDVDRNTDNVKREAKRAEDKARPVIDAAKPVTRAIGKEADRRIDQLKIGGRVTAALKANANLPQSIRVDADDDANGVKLRGTVKTAEQKQLAERIARDTIGKEKKVQNDLKVEP